MSNPYSDIPGFTNFSEVWRMTYTIGRSSQRYAIFTSIDSAMKAMNGLISRALKQPNAVEMGVRSPLVRIVERGIHTICRCSITSERCFEEPPLVQLAMAAEK